MARSGPLRLERRDESLGGLAISGDYELVMEAGQASEIVARLDSAPERVTRQAEPILGEPQEERTRHLELAFLAAFLMPFLAAFPMPFLAAFLMPFLAAFPATFLATLADIVTGEVALVHVLAMLHLVLQGAPHGFVQ
jgi:hypothetical protein